MEDPDYVSDSEEEQGMVQVLLELMTKDHSSGAARYLWENLTTTIQKIQTIVTPSGPFHLALSFGPLIFEAGVPG